MLWTNPPDVCYNESPNLSEEINFVVKRSWILLHLVLIALLFPTFACGSIAGRVTPTPTKTPRPFRTVVNLPTVTPTPTPTDTPIPTDTPTPTPIPTDTPTPIPTDTPTNTPPPPPPPPPPTDTPLPPPADTPTPLPPAAPPPPPSSKPDVIVELPDGNTFSSGDEVKIIFIVRDPDGVKEFTWGVFTQNQTPLIGGERNCNNATECREEVEAVAPPVSGTYLVGADAIDAHGNTARGVGEIYVP